MHVLENVHCKPIKVSQNLRTQISYYTVSQGRLLLSERDLLLLQSLCAIQNERSTCSNLSEARACSDARVCVNVVRRRTKTLVSFILIMKETKAFLLLRIQCIMHGLLIINECMRYRIYS